MTWITTPGRAELLRYGKILSDDEIEKEGHFIRYREIEYGGMIWAMKEYYGEVSYIVEIGRAKK